MSGFSLGEIFEGKIIDQYFIKQWAIGSIVLSIVLENFTGATTFKGKASLLAENQAVCEM